MKLSQKLGGFISVATLLAALALAVCAPTTTATISVESTKTSVVTSERNALTARIAVLSPGDPYLRITPSSCVLAVSIDGIRVDDPQIPFCGDRSGRTLFVSALQHEGIFQIDLEMGRTAITRAAFHAEPSAWKILTIGILLLASLILGSFPIVQQVSLRLSRFKSNFELVLSSGRSAGVVLLMLWTLLYYRHSSNEASHMLGVLLLDCYAVWLLFRRNRESQPTNDSSAKSNMVARGALLVVALSMLLVVGFISTIRHDNLESRAFDLAIQENVLWNSLHGSPFISSIMGGIPYLGNHTVVAYTLLLPLYYLLPSTYTLLWFQAAIVVATGLPLFLVARYLLRSEIAASCISISFLLHPALLGASSNDFHELALAPCALAWLMYAVVFQRSLLLALMVLLCSSIKEDMSLNLVVLGAGLLATRYVTQGVYLVLCGVASYIFWQDIVIPAFAGFQSSYTWYLAEALGRDSSPFEIIIRVIEAPFNTIIPLINPDKVMFLMKSLGASLFLPCLSLGGSIMTSYGVALALLSGHSPLYTFGYHYVFPWLTLAMFACIFVVRDIRISWLRHLSVVSILLAHCVLFVLFGPIYPLESFRYGPTQSANPFVSTASPQLISAVAWVKSSIPKDASVVTTETLAPHFSTRKRVQVRRRANSTISAIFDYCIEERNSVTSTCASVGCKGGEVPTPYTALIVCRQDASSPVMALEGSL